MERAIAVRGKLTDAKHIELDEPVTDIEGPVEVVLRPNASRIRTIPGNSKSTGIGSIGISLRKP
jgi:hypothetical protein